MLRGTRFRSPRQRLIPALEEAMDSEGLDDVGRLASIEAHPLESRRLAAALRRNGWL
ncbi:MAG: hypothetical protein QG597_1873 [Actinomycetota bacterium]|nr:hypothetical protein [Actinomycetota bacterium]